MTTESLLSIDLSSHSLVQVREKPDPYALKGIIQASRRDIANRCIRPSERLEVREKLRHQWICMATMAQQATLYLTAHPNTTLAELEKHLFSPEIYSILSQHQITHSKNVLMEIFERSSLIQEYFPQIEMNPIPILERLLMLPPNSFHGSFCFIKSPNGIHITVDNDEDFGILCGDLEQAETCVGSAIHSLYDNMSFSIGRSAKNIHQFLQNIKNDTEWIDSQEKKLSQSAIQRHEQRHLRHEFLLDDTYPADDEITQAMRVAKDEIVARLCGGSSQIEVQSIFQKKESPYVPSMCDIGNTIAFRVFELEKDAAKYRALSSETNASERNQMILGITNQQLRDARNDRSRFFQQIEEYRENLKRYIPIAFAVQKQYGELSYDLLAITPIHRWEWLIET